MDTQHKERHDSQSELWLIAHKVRGEPAFDIATRFKCPICEPIRQGLDPEERGSIHCDECDEGQYWWVIPTSGHRAYPFWIAEIPIGHIEGDTLIYHGHRDQYAWKPADYADIPDHYQTTAAPGTGITDLFSKLGFKKVAGPQVTRRI